jgi:hypothetical protein
LLSYIYIYSCFNFIHLVMLYDYYVIWNIVDCHQIVNRKMFITSDMSHLLESRFCSINCSILISPSFVKPILISLALRQETLHDFLPLRLFRVFTHSMTHEVNTFLDTPATVNAGSLLSNVYKIKLFHSLFKPSHMFVKYVLQFSFYLQNV